MNSKLFVKQQKLVRKMLSWKYANRCLLMKAFSNFKMTISSTSWFEEIIYKDFFVKGSLIYLHLFWLMMDVDSFISPYFVSSLTIFFSLILSFLTCYAVSAFDGATPSFFTLLPQYCMQVHLHAHTQTLLPISPSSYYLTLEGF